VNKLEEDACLAHISHSLLPITAVLLAVTPVGNLGLALMLLLVADFLVVLLIARLIAARRKKKNDSVVVLGSDVPMHLYRRTRPPLRSRRPTGVVEMQVRWRQAAEAHRRNREKA
jgi:hypothetical protein